MVNSYDKTKGADDSKDWDVFRLLRSIVNRSDVDEHVIMIALAVVVGLLTGGVAILFGFLLEFTQDFFSEGIVGHTSGAIWWGRYLLPLVPAIGGLIVGLLIHFGAKEAKGPGVSEVMNAVATRGGIIRARSILVKAFASAICIGSGGSAGREGPIVHIGSGLGSVVGKVLSLSSSRVKLLVGCGAAAGIAATFNAPIAGALFAAEVILGTFSVKAFGPIIISAVIGSSLSRMFFGDHPAITVTEYVLRSPFELILYAILGLILGFGAVLFTKSLFGFEDKITKITKNLPAYVRPALGGLLVGIIGIWLPQVMGIGYQWMDLVFQGGFVWWMLIILFFGKIIATSLTLGSGGSGGIFAPSLYMGAMFGGFFGILVNGMFPGFTAPPGAYALIGMGAMVGGTSHAPLTAIIMIFEMTDDYSIILPLMVAIVISTVTAKRLELNSIYTLKLARRGINIRQGRDVDVLESISVSEIMRHHFEWVPPGMLYGDLLNFIVVSRQNCFPVVGENDKLLGVISLQNIRRWMNEPSLANLVIVDELSTKGIVTVTADENLLSALVKFERIDVESLPVINDEKSYQIMGLLYRDDVNKAYRSRTLGKIVQDD